MNEAGVDRPSREIKERKNEPGGVSVKPATYRLEINYLEETSSSNIEVKSDPRVKVSEKAINETYKIQKEIEQMRQTAADAVKQLVESKNTAEKYKKELTEEDKKKYKNQIKLSKEVVKKTDSIIDLFLGKKDKRQGITSSSVVTVMQRLGTASWYSGSRPNGITQTEMVLLEQAKKQLEEVLKKTNSFFNTEWTTYKTEMEQLVLSPFKKTQSFKIKKE